MKPKLEKSKIEFEDLSPKLDKNDDYNLRADLLGDKMKNDSKSFGVCICVSSNGICFAMNRHRHIRAIQVVKRETVRMGRVDTDANVICLSGKLMTPSKAHKMVKLFLNTPFAKAERHIRRIKAVSKQRLLQVFW